MLKKLNMVWNRIESNRTGSIIKLRHDDITYKLPENFDLVLFSLESKRIMSNPLTKFSKFNNKSIWSDFPVQ